MKAENVDPSNYRDLQKWASNIEGLPGNAKKSKLQEEFRNRQEEVVEDVENTESDQPDRGNEEGSTEEPGEIEEETPETPEKDENDKPSFDFEGTRDEGNHVFEKEASEIAKNLEEDTDTEEEDIEPEDEGSEEDKLDTEQVEDLEVDPAFFQLFHRGINKGLRKLFNKFFGFKPDTLKDEEVQKMGEATEVLAQNRLTPDQKETLEKAARGQGVIGGHVKAAFRGLVTEDTETEEEQSENREKDESEDSDEPEEEKPIETAEEESDEPKFGNSNPFR